MSPDNLDGFEHLRGQRGRIIGDHPWAGHNATVCRAEKTLVGWGLVVAIDDGPDVPPGQEAFIFEPKFWQPQPRRAGRK